MEYFFSFQLGQEGCSTCLLLDYTKELTKKKKYLFQEHSKWRKVTFCLWLQSWPSGLSIPTQNPQILFTRFDGFQLLSLQQKLLWSCPTKKLCLVFIFFRCIFSSTFIDYVRTILRKTNIFLPHDTHTYVLNFA